MPIVGVGMVLAVVSMIVAASIEFARKADIQKNGYIQQEVAGKIFNASDLSVFAQIPQYTFIGASEVFASITSEYFCYFPIMEETKMDKLRTFN